MPPVVLLVEVSLPENLGAVARGMANFGLRELRLVGPAVSPDDAKAVAVAAGGAAILAGARTYADLGAATADLEFVWATTALDRELPTPRLDARALAARVRSTPDARTGLLFGPERTGLRYEHLERADGLVHIPTDPGCRALNLAQAVNIVAYEWAMAGEVPASTAPVPAPRAEQDALYDELTTALLARGWLSNPTLRPRALRNLRSALLRGGFTAPEIRTLRGAFRALQRPLATGSLPGEPADEG